MMAQVDLPPPQTLSTLPGGELAWAPFMCSPAALSYNHLA